MKDLIDFFQEWQELRNEAPGGWAHPTRDDIQHCQKQIDLLRQLQTLHCDQIPGERLLVSQTLGKLEENLRILKS